MTLLHPLFLIPAALCLVTFAVLRAQTGGDDWARVLARPVLAFLRPAVGASGLNFALLALAVVFAALASPSVRADRGDSYALDEGVVVLVDVSKSMGIDDIRPNRMTAARAAVLQISNELGARPAALIAYSGDAFLLEPFAIDRRQFDAFAAALDVGLVPQDGSNLERALALAISVIDQASVGRARLVIISDGGGFTSDTEAIARRIAGQGHRVDVVQFGDPATTVPVAADVDSMQRTADAGKGVQVSVNTAGLADLGALRLSGSLLDQPGTTGLALRSTEWRNLSHLVLLLALPVLLLAFRQVRQ